MIKKITPPTTRKLSTEIPKNLNNNCPVNANAIMVKNDTIEAFLAVLFRSSTVKSAVIDINTGMVPNGFINVKNEVMQRSAKEIVSDMIFII
jgi:hypothetical protein